LGERVGLRWVWDVEDLHVGDKVVKDHYCEDDHNGNGNGDHNGNGDDDHHGDEGQRRRSRQ
jgi:hypothetical protein